MGDRHQKPASATLTPAPKGQRFSYIRVSSTDQNLARQRSMIGQVDKEFLDEVSARSRAARPGLERCIDYLRDHDELIVASIDRLARSLVDLRGISDLVFPREIILWAVRWYCRYKVSYQDFVGEMVGRGVPVEQRAIYR